MNIRKLNIVIVAGSQEITPIIDFLNNKGHQIMANVKDLLELKHFLSLNRSGLDLVVLISDNHEHIRTEGIGVVEQAKSFDLPTVLLNTGPFFRDCCQSFLAVINKEIPNAQDLNSVSVAVNRHHCLRGF
jgi:hypothetical protein